MADFQPGDRVRMTEQARKNGVAPRNVAWPIFGTVVGFAGGRTLTVRRDERLSVVRYHVSFWEVVVSTSVAELPPVAVLIPITPNSRNTFIGVEGWQHGVIRDKQGRLSKLARAFAAGMSIREAARCVGCSKTTARKVFRIFSAASGKPFLCPCGQPNTHQGWCSHRYALSPVRQEVMAKLHTKQAQA